MADETGAGVLGAGDPQGGDQGGAGGGQSGGQTPATPDWAVPFTPEAQSFITTKGWQSPDALVESYKSLESKLGTPQEYLLKLPKDDDAQGWNEFYTKLGRPAEAKDYKLPEIQIGEGELDLRPWAAGMAHELGLSQAKFDKLVGGYEAYRQEQKQTARGLVVAEQQKQLEEVKTEWGDDYDPNVATARKGMKALGFDGKVAAAIESVVGTRELMMRMHNVGRLLGEHQAGAHGGEQNAGYMSPAQARSEIEKMQADIPFMEAWTNADLPGHTQAKKRMDDLFKLAYPAK